METVENAPAPTRVFHRSHSPYYDGDHEPLFAELDVHNLLSA